MENPGERKRWLMSALYMDTVVNLTVVTDRARSEVGAAMARAFQAFAGVERACSRFSPESELSALSAQPGVPVRVSETLFQALRFALEVAQATDGAFDPTVGRQLEAYGFDRDYRTGRRRQPGAGGEPILDGGPAAGAEPVSYRDLVLDEARHTVLLSRPMVIDLGAVAKGLAIDLAARELMPFEGFLIDAGGDIFELTGAAVCTSGGYERPSPVRADTSYHRPALRPDAAGTAQLHRGGPLCHDGRCTLNCGVCPGAGAWN